MSNLRPGVYSSYTTSWGYHSGGTSIKAGLVCLGSASICGVLHKVESSQQATNIFGSAPENKYLLKYVELLFKQGVSVVLVSVVNTTYKAAMEILQKEEQVGIVFSDSYSFADCQEVLNSVIESGENQKERLCFFGASTAEKGIALAKELNHPRSVVVAGNTNYEGHQHSLFGACVFGGKILSLKDPSYNLNGMEIADLSLEEEFSEKDIQYLLAAGASPLETVGIVVECVRGVTTRTTSGGAIDTSYRSINSLMIIDDVMSSIRKSLQRQLKGLRTLDKNLQTIATQVTLLLEEKITLGRITSYQPPKVSVSLEDSTLCVVEIGFTIAHVVSQIYLSAQVQL